MNEDKYYVLGLVTVLMLGVVAGIEIANSVDYEYTSWNKKYMSSSTVCDNFGGISSFDLNWEITCKDGTVIQK